MNSVIGQKSPDFILLDDSGQSFSSKNLDGAWRIIFFYARDGSPTCKRGCLTFKEQYDLFESAGCKIVGISRDSVEQHKEFKKDLGRNHPSQIKLNLDLWIKLIKMLINSL